jgi:hypothetical protein
VELTSNVILYHILIFAIGERGELAKCMKNIFTTIVEAGSWKKALHKKAMFFEKNAHERHNILGSYP